MTPEEIIPVLRDHHDEYKNEYGGYYVALACLEAAQLIEEQRATIARLSDPYTEDEWRNTHKHLLPQAIGGLTPIDVANAIREERLNAR